VGARSGFLHSTLSGGAKKNTQKTKVTNFLAVGKKLTCLLVFRLKKTTVRIVEALRPRRIKTFNRAPPGRDPFAGSDCSDLSFSFFFFFLSVERRSTTRLRGQTCNRQQALWAGPSAGGGDVLRVHVPSLIGTSRRDTVGDVELPSISCPGIDFWVCAWGTSPGDYSPTQHLRQAV